ncbi:MAG TPA: transcription termination factor NusA [Candidatus Hydrogenedens sp.]|nr:transcription termination factor NusA [Candidatus Hydrogenedens sp.]HPP57855.1 transcription termination factor NusA [Candidatus Hydrogenedens sp.]
MNQEIKKILDQLELEKNIDRKALIEAIRSAVEVAARKEIGPKSKVIVELSHDTFEFKVFEIRTVVEKVEEPTTQIALEEAVKLNPNVNKGNLLKVPTEIKGFGRIAAQAAKQVIIQKIKEAEKEQVYSEFKQREGDLVTGTVKRVSKGEIIVALGRAEAILPVKEQTPGEIYRPNDRIKAYVLKVERKDKNQKGPVIVLSRSAPQLVKALFANEVPEIYEGIVEIKAVARDPGRRCKIAVISHDPNVDPIGACVGLKGARVRAIVEELGGEKIDIIEWSDNPAELCARALNPADIIDVSVNAEKKLLLVAVPQDQLSLAIGKHGQNAKLASRLVGWNIDIKAEQVPKEEKTANDE